ncbi:MAG: DUF6076 domain-containing protein [Clostridia bacterium]
MELYLGREYKSFYYKYYPKTKEECFCYIDGNHDYNCVAKELEFDRANKYPLGFLLSKYVQFYEQLYPTYWSSEKYDTDNRELKDIKNEIIEFYNMLSDDMKEEPMFYIEKRKRIFENVFPKTGLVNNMYKYENTETYDCIELFSFFLLNDIYETEESILEFQKEKIVASTVILDFIKRCVTTDYEFSSYENLCITAMNNQHNLDNGYTVFENNNKLQRLNNKYQNGEYVVREKEVYHLYRIENISSFLYATLQEILNNNHVIKRCEYCKSIFVPLKSKSNKYCNYLKYGMHKRTCYELNNSGVVIFKEKHNRCEKVRKQIRDRLNKWVEYTNLSNCSESEYKRRKAIKKNIYDIIKRLKNTIKNEDEYYTYLIRIKDTDLKNESEYKDLMREMESILKE